MFTILWSFTYFIYHFLTIEIKLLLFIVFIYLLVVNIHKVDCRNVNMFDVTHKYCAVSVQHLATVLATELSIQHICSECVYFAIVSYIRVYLLLYGCVHLRIILPYPQNVQKVYLLNSKTILNFDTCLVEFLDINVFINFKFCLIAKYEKPCTCLS